MLSKQDWAKVAVRLRDDLMFEVLWTQATNAGITGVKKRPPCVDSAFLAYFHLQGLDLKKWLPGIFHEHNLVEATFNFYHPLEQCRY